jgi:hypothetical protein
MTQHFARDNPKTLVARPDPDWIASLRTTK